MYQMSARTCRAYTRFLKTALLFGTLYSTDMVEALYLG